MADGPLSAIAPDGVVLGEEREIPDGIAQLLGRSTHPLRVKMLSSTSCTLAWGDAEFRFQMRTDGVWEWDEVVGRFWVHIEQMSDSAYWMGLHPLAEDGTERGDDRVCIDIYSKSGRAQVVMTGWMD